MTNNKHSSDHPYYVNIAVAMCEDDKILIIESMPERDAIILIFIRLILLAGKTNDNGLIYIAPELPYTIENLSAVLRRPLNIVRLAIEVLSNLKMVEIQPDGCFYLPNFQKWQHLEALSKIRKLGAERSKKYRDNLKNKQLTQSTSGVNGVNG